MKTILLILFLCVFVYSLPKQENKKLPEDALTNCDINGLKIPDGQSAPALIGKCIIYSCIIQDNQQTVQALTCPEFRYDPNKCYEQEMNLSVPYPDCCPQVICNN